MEMDRVDPYGPMETALKESGYVVDGIEKQSKKTVITAYRGGQGGENPAFAAGGLSKEAARCGEPAGSRGQEAL